ncbi:ribosome hibernation-promoting factor, HPF/YfiA family [Arcanobacterium pinnipediorum]|uniref:Ribosome hibernation promoting factor n=1 Tax=Arcanobacterium pinnipediorum TaxID=1503041 RepID=A0ABY5AIV4_9ACTO|nr:ribosome-associated translation inhibitor RaiA [Arcanobacterium pinnipediorum]USR79118.1 ribosome-associated translation inhibitor RaiA [Arcanobacterium pinnipediorum]
MEFVVKGRNAEVSDNFREFVIEKLAKIEQFAPRAQRVEVEVTHEPNPAQAEVSERIEITVRDKGPVVRAEAATSDRYGSVDIAAQKLFERLRRKSEKMKDRKHQAAKDMQAGELDVDQLLQEVTATNVDTHDSSDLPTHPTVVGEAVEVQVGDSPVVVRQKLYEAKPMSVEQAIDEMELVGHPFYLFIDEETSQPCAAYRRRGWTYGVIRLDAKTGEFGPGESA